MVSHNEEGVSKLLKREREALGCYVSGHPLFRYQSKLGRLGVVFSTKVSAEDPWSMVSVAGIVENYQEKIRGVVALTLNLPVNQLN